MLLQGLFSTQLSPEVYTNEGGTIISCVSRPWLQSLEANLPRLATNELWGWMLPGAEQVVEVNGNQVHLAFSKMFHALAEAGCSESCNGDGRVSLDAPLSNNTKNKISKT